MVAWFKHDIPAWMDATESLSDGAYRVYHVVCQLIYLNEGPIRVNEQGIAGRCNMHVLSLRHNLNLLTTLGLLTLNPSGTLSQPRADRELEKIGLNRVKAGSRGGSSRKPLKEKESSEALLLDTQSSLPTDKTRLEETREEKKEMSADALPHHGWPDDYLEQFWAAYPKRVDKKTTFKKLDQIRRAGKVPWATLIGGVHRYAGKVLGKDQTYTKGPAAWLNAGKWDDEYAPIHAGAMDEVCPPDIYRNLL